MPDATRTDLIVQIEAAISERGGKREGNDVRFRCPYPARHHNGDEHPSARWNSVKRVWRCDVCGASGGYMNLARTLGIDTQTDRDRLAWTIDRLDGCPPRSERTGPSQEKVASARRLWLAGRPAVRTAVETYLRSRGITIDIPTTIRYVARAWHAEAGTCFPAMVAAVHDPIGRLIGVHRTFLASDGRGKAPVSPAKKMLGACAGGAVRLTEAGLTLAVTEGIETGLSVLQATARPTWVGLSAAGVAALVLPPMPLAAEVMIFADHDPAGIDAAERAALRWHYEDRSVRVVLPPTPGRDFNDLLRGVA